MCNTPGTRGGPGGRDQTLEVRSGKNARKSVFFLVKKWVKSKRLNDGNNNGQATHGARKPPGPIIELLVKSN